LTIPVELLHIPIFDRTIRRTFF